ncbi:MAG TPA: response regulator, partial [Pirellulales bacterium]|nr:response regulator [Pirellulales bacterium]
MPSPLILVIEDESPIRKFLRVSLTGEEYRIEEAETGKQGLTMAASQPPDLVILDLGLPDMDGLDVLRSLREWLSAPVIVLSARGQERDKVAALDAGADDYLTKPFGVGELLARVRVAFRHTARAGEGKTDPKFVVGELTVDLAARRVFVGQREIHLTPLEYKLLTVMVQHAGKVLTHRFLLKEVWGPGQV